MGVGATKRLSAVRWGVGKRIVYAWIITIPASGSSSISIDNNDSSYNSQVN